MGTQGVSKHEARRLRGLCMHCPGKLSTKWECAACAKASAARARAYQAKNESAGLCRSCGKAPVARARRCLPCRKKEVLANAKSVRKRVAAGICAKCIRPVMPGKKTHCEIHLKRQREYRAKSLALERAEAIGDSGCADCDARDDLLISERLGGAILCKLCFFKRLKSSRIVHGTAAGRIQYGCHCQPCVDAAREVWRASTKRERERLRANQAPRAPAVIADHGTYRRYASYGCRCEPCRKAGSDYNRASRLRRLARANQPGAVA